MKKPSLGQMIRARRNKIGLTAEELAIKVGINRTYISKIERHDFLPSPKVLTDIVIALKDNPNKYTSIYKSLKIVKTKNMLKQKMKKLAEKYKHL